MKNTKTVIFTLIGFSLMLMLCHCGVRKEAVATGNSSTMESDSIQATTRLAELIVNCRRGQFEEAASMIAYRGDDESRKWKDTFDYSRKEEKARVSNTCRRLIDILPENGKYQILEHYIENESEGTWHILQVDAGENHTVYIGFLDLNGKLVLGDID